MDKIKDNLPLISLCLLIICTLNTVIYYSYFGIDILSYLDFTETLQIQFKPFAISASFIIGIIIIISFTSFFVNRLEDKFVVYSPEDFERDYKRLEFFKDKNIVLPEREPSAHYKKSSIREHEYHLRLQEAERNDVTKFHWTEKAKPKIAIAFPFALLGLFIYLYNYLSPSNLRNFLLASNIAFLIALIFSYLSFRESVEVQRDDVKTQARRDLLKIICITVFVAYAGGSYAQASAIKIVLNHSEHEVVLVTEEKTIATSKNYRYIGKSKDYIFFYNINKKQADVFKLDKVKYLSITDGIEYK